MHEPTQVISRSLATRERLSAAVKAAPPRKKIVLICRRTREPGAARFPGLFPRSGLP